MRDATTLGGDETCVRGVAFGDRIDPTELEMVVRVSGEAVADRVENPATEAGDAFAPARRRPKATSGGCR